MVQWWVRSTRQFSDFDNLLTSRASGSISVPTLSHRQKPPLHLPRCPPTPSTCGKCTSTSSYPTVHIHNAISSNPRWCSGKCMLTDCSPRPPTSRDIVGSQRHSITRGFSVLGLMNRRFLLLDQTPTTRSTPQRRVVPRCTTGATAVH